MTEPFAARFDAVLVGEDVTLAAAAVVVAGGRVLDRADWGRAGRVGGLEVGDSAVLVVEAEGADESVLADVLPALARAAAERGCKIVASFGPEQIDVLAASLLEMGADLLCPPDEMERVAALLRAVAEPRPGEVREEGGGPRRPFGVEPPDGPPADPEALRRHIRARRMRDGFFMPGLFADPAWDMLLDLYAAELEDEPVSVSSLCIAAAVAPTTALRWIARMQEDGLLERRPDLSDRRRAFMGLTEVARVGMAGYLSALRRAGLAIG